MPDVPIRTTPDQVDEAVARAFPGASGGVLWARADLLSAGSRKVVGSVRVWCDDARDRPSSVAKGTYVLPAT